MNHQISGNRIGIALTALAACLTCSILGGGLIAHGEAIKSAPDVVIYDGTYPGWPWIDRAADGTLMCIWREGYRHEYSSNGKMMFSTSADDGKTWSAARTVQDAGPNIDDRGGGILALSNDEWLAAYFTTDGDSVSRTWTTRTTDGGATWSAPARVNPAMTENNAARAAPIILSSGELVLPYYRGGSSHQALAAVSSDNGRTWTTCAIPNTTGFKGNEWSVVELADGTLAGIIRNGAPNNDGSLWMTKSADRGCTWSAPQKTNLQDTSGLAWKSPAQIFLHNGKPWALYDDERYVSVALATTDDPDLLDWNIDDRIKPFQYKPDGTRISDTGYPCGVQLDDGRMLIVDYYIDGGTRRIVGYYATLPAPEPGTSAMLAVAAAAGSAYVWKKRGKSAIRAKE